MEYTQIPKLQHVIIESEDTRVTIFPTVVEDGTVFWHGAITMPGQTIIEISDCYSKEEVITQAIKAIETYVIKLMTLAKAILAQQKRLGIQVKDSTE